MIVLSLLLVVASAAALGWGIATSTQGLVLGSLLAGLAAAALVAGSVARRRGQPLEEPRGTAEQPAAPVERSQGSPVGPSVAGPEPPGSPPAGSPPPGLPPEAARPPADPPWGTPPAALPSWNVPPPAGPPPAGPPPAGATASGRPVDAPPDRTLGEPFPPPDAGPPDMPSAAGPAAPADDEPPVEDLPVRDALRVAQLDDTVLVLDGHPRYHLAGCRILGDVEPIPLPVSSARRGGFTPCAVCGPDRTLLARAQDRRAAMRDEAAPPGPGELPG